MGREKTENGLEEPIIKILQRRGSQQRAKLSVLRLGVRDIVERPSPQRSGEKRQCFESSRRLLGKRAIRDAAGNQIGCLVLVDFCKQKHSDFIPRDQYEHLE